MPKKKRTVGTPSISDFFAKKVKTNESSEAEKSKSDNDLLQPSCSQETTNVEEVENDGDDVDEAIISTLVEETHETSNKEISNAFKDSEEIDENFESHENVEKFDENVEKSDQNDMNYSENNPFHPPKSFKFPKTQSGTGKNMKMRSCQHEWFQKFDWLHYHTENNKVYCFYCQKAFREKLLLNSPKEMTFCENGFQNWKKALESFKQHDKSECHLDAMSKLKKPEAKDVGELISVKHANEKSDNR